MGRAIEQIARAKGHSIVAIVGDRRTDLSNVISAYQPTVV